MSEGSSSTHPDQSQALRWIIHSSESKQRSIFMLTAQSAYRSALRIESRTCDSSPHFVTTLDPVLLWKAAISFLHSHQCNTPILKLILPSSHCTLYANNQIIRLYFLVLNWVYRKIQFVHPNGHCIPGAPLRASLSLAYAFVRWFYPQLALHSMHTLF